MSRAVMGVSTVHQQGEMKRMIRWLPIIAVEIYLLFTLALYIWGPWDFQTINPTESYILLFMYQLALFLGYFVAMKTVRFRPARSYRTKESLIRIVEILSVINMFFLVMNLTRDLGLKYISVPAIVDRFINGISNPAKVYFMKFEVTDVSKIFLGRIGTIMNFCWSIVSYSIIPLNCLLFSCYKKDGKCIALLNILLSATRYIAIGTNKGIFDIVIFSLTACLISYFRKNRYTFNMSKLLKTVFIFVLLLLPALFFFNKAIGTRGIGHNWSTPGYAIGGKVFLDRESVIFDILPEGLIGICVLLTTYIAQGYYGFAATTAVKWTPMFGLGNSMFLVDQLNLNEYTLQYKAQQLYGWDSRVQWHTIYSWLANDVSVYGVILVMFLIGFVFAIVYAESILYDNPISELLCCFFMILFFFIPANNQMANGMSQFMSFYFAILVWLLCRSRYFKLKIGNHIL